MSDNVLPVIPVLGISSRDRPTEAGWQWEDPHEWHSFRGKDKNYVLVADGSRVYGIDDTTLHRLQQIHHQEDKNPHEQLCQSLSVSPQRFVDDLIPESLPIRSLSLAVAQKCNLGCTYCYAEGGSFGGTAKNMSLDVALQAVNRLFDEINGGEKLHLAFLGGEPLVNRTVLQAATEAAQQRATDERVTIGFSITTNGTLLNEEDLEFFERHGFSVTISLDGVGQSHDQLRPFKGGRGSYEAVLERVQPLLEKQKNMQVSARVTVTPSNISLRETLDEFVRLGFHSVGFSPMLSSPTGLNEMGTNELRVMLEQMIQCGQEFVKNVKQARRYPFANMVNAMREIHKGTHRPYPCGAGGGYFGVSADGDLYACHRFVGDEQGHMGDLKNGVDIERQKAWLASRHVHFQTPCNGCWARYLCGGGCHHEVMNRGRPACDYIRGWLHFCLQSYVELLESVPDYFGVPSANGNH